MSHGTPDAPVLPRVLVLSKRQYMGRDLIDERYGRFWELPQALADLGHAVQGVSLSYRSRPEGEVRAGGVNWECVSARRALLSGGATYRRVIDRVGAHFRPQVIWACSDVPNVVLGVGAARRLRVPLVIDLYDNFESYPLSRIPGVNRALNSAAAGCDGLSVISEPLRDHVLESYRPRGEVVVIENGVPPTTLRPHDRNSCRAEFDLPLDEIVVGTAGAISAGRGVQHLIAAFERFVRVKPKSTLLLAGPSDSSVRIPSGDSRIRYLGSIPPDQVPRLLSSLDIAVVCNRDTPFGKFCFPQKFYEALACGIPVAVANVGSLKALLVDHSHHLFEPDDAESLFRALMRLAERPSQLLLPVPTWPGLAGKLSALLQRASQVPR